MRSHALMNCVGFVQRIESPKLEENLKNLREVSA